VRDFVSCSICRSNPRINSNCRFDPVPVKSVEDITDQLLGQYQYLNSLLQSTCSVRLAWPVVSQLLAANDEKKHKATFGFADALLFGYIVKGLTSAVLCKSVAELPHLMSFFATLASRYFRDNDSVCEDGSWQVCTDALFLSLSMAAYHVVIFFN
jgi:hypothetical protein